MTTLAERMKNLEHTHRRTLPANSYAVLRLDGRAFHTYTRGLQRPYDETFAADMDAAAAAVAAEASGCVLAYVQSDEISLLLTDTARERTQLWFGGVEAKMTSISASLASVVLNERRPGGGRALFDARVVALPTLDDVADYFIWRQRDCVKNSVSMAGQSRYGHKRLLGQNTDAVRAMLADDGQPWEELPQGFRFGRLLRRSTEMTSTTYTRRDTGVEHTSVHPRTVWTTRPAPQFSRDPEQWPLAGLTAAQERAQVGDDGLSDRERQDLAQQWLECEGSALTAQEYRGRAAGV